MFNLKLAFAGLWPVVLDYGWPLTIIGSIIALEVFSVTVSTYVPFLSPLLSKFRKTLWWIATVAAIALAWGIKMQHDEKARCDAKANVVIDQVDKAVTKSKTTPTGKAEDDNL